MRSDMWSILSSRSLASSGVVSPSLSRDYFSSMVPSFTKCLQSVMSTFLIYLNILISISSKKWNYATKYANAAVFRSVERNTYEECVNDAPEYGKEGTPYY